MGKQDIEVREEGRGSQRTASITLTTADGVTVTVGTSADSDHFEVTAKHPDRFVQVQWEPTSSGEGELRVLLGALKPSSQRHTPT